MNRLSIYDRLSLGLALVTVVLTLGLYSGLADPLPTHFDLHGHADGFMPKWLGAWFGLGIGALVFALIRWAHRVLPGEWGSRMSRSPMGLVSFLLVGLFAAIQVIILYAGSANHPDVSRLLGFVLAGFWLLMGLVFPRLRRNPFVGIRTTWTLTSDENWSRTHRVGGLLFVAAGLVALVGALAGSLPAVLAAVVTSALAAAAYSFYLARVSLR